MVQWNSLLENKPKEQKEVEIEADVIVTATVLGFIGHRYQQQEYCRFDMEYPSESNVKAWEEIDQAIQTQSKKPTSKQVVLKYLWELEEGKKPNAPDSKVVNEEELKSLENAYKKNIQDYRKYLRDYQEFVMVLDAMSEVLNQTNAEMGEFLQVSQSPQLKKDKKGENGEEEKEKGALITGFPDGARLLFEKRQKGVVSKTAIDLVAKILNGERKDIYEGRGAYTGLVDVTNDPNNEIDLVWPTRRVIDENLDRWHPNETIYTDWGLIKPTGDEEINLSKDLKKGMGPLPKITIGKTRTGLEIKTDGKTLGKGNKRIGYIHGMCSAILKCKSIKAQEPSCKCIPFELATGNETTKMASCFACCTYMYTTNFPPSSMHLGRAESWVPPHTDYTSGEIDFKSEKIAELPNYDSKISSAQAKRWHAYIYKCMESGQKYLEKAVGTPNKSLVSNAHRLLVEKLKAKLEKIEQKEIPIIGGNLFLDALTIHNSDWKRIQNTLRPAYEQIRKEQEDKVKNFGNQQQQQSLVKSFSYSRSNSTPATPSTQLASSDKPALLNGMKVIFDESVGVYPVTLESKAEAQHNGSGY